MFYPIPSKKDLDLSNSTFVLVRVCISFFCPLFRFCHFFSHPFSSPAFPLSLSPSHPLSLSLTDSNTFSPHLFQPSVGVGNVGQLALDAIIVTYEMEKVGYFHDPNLIPGTSLSLSSLFSPSHSFRPSFSLSPHTSLSPSTFISMLCICNRP